MEITACSTKTRKKLHKPEAQFRHALDTCSKTNDLQSALALYHSASSSNIPLSSYHFNTLLHILSSSLHSPNPNPQTAPSSLATAFSIFRRIPSPAESAVTSMARIAAHPSNARPDIAFDLVKTMADAPKLRTYSPALLSFCKTGEAEKAYSVEDHMSSKGILPEEAEIAALIDVSAREGRGERVYGYLQKLRVCGGGGVGMSTVEVLERWFGSEVAAEVGTGEWDVGRVRDAVLGNGGGFHGLGWLGRGGWEVARGGVGGDGCCGCCGGRLACVDIDERETMGFAEAVARLAVERESGASFGGFQVNGFGVCFLAFLVGLFFCLILCTNLA